MKTTTRLVDIIKEEFDYDNVVVDMESSEIIIWYRLTERPPAYSPRVTEWCPSKGGPLYGQAAITHCNWLADHITKFRDLLPQTLQGFSVVVRKL